MSFVGLILVAGLLGVDVGAARPTAAAPADGASDVDPLGPERQLVTGERGHRILELVAADAGHVLPTFAGPLPWRRADRIVRDAVAAPDAADGLSGPLRLSTAGRAALRFALRSFALVDDPGAGWAVQVSPVFAPEVHVRTTPVADGPLWDVGFRERQGVFGLDAQARVRLFDDVEVWGRGTYDLRLDQNAYAAPGAAAAGSNVVDPVAWDMSFPHRALVGLGGARFGLLVGRDRLAIGNGRTANLMVGDSADVHDFVRAQIFLPSVTWTSLILRLDPVLLDDEGTRWGLQDAIAVEKHLVVHRLELVVLDKLLLAATEGSMIGGVPLDLRHLNPLLIFHNLFAWNEVAAYEAAAALVTLEATAVPLRGLRLWGQYAIQQLQTPFERTTYPGAADALPDATAFLAGGELSAPVAWSASPRLPWARPADTAFVVFGGELVHVDPWFGLTAHPWTTFASRRRLPSNLGATVPGSTAVVERPLGPRLGPDSRSLRVWVGAVDVGLGELELWTELRLRGEQTLRTFLVPGPAATALTTPTGIVEQSRVTGLSWALLPLRAGRIALTVRFDWRHFVVDNAGHVAGVTVVDDQFVASTRLDL